MYTDNDLIYYDNRTLLERFTTPIYNDHANIFVKSIVRGDLNKTIFYPKRSSHVPLPNLEICDSVGTIIKNYDRFAIKHPVHKYGFIKHFKVKSVEEFVNKTKILMKTNAINLDSRIKGYFKRNKFSQEKLKYFEEKFNKSFNWIYFRIHKN